MEFLRKKSGICVNRSRTALRNQIWSHIVAYAHSLKTMRTRSHLNFHMTPNSYRNGLKLTLQAGFFDLEACFFTNKMPIRSGLAKNWPYKRIDLTSMDHTSGLHCIYKIQKLQPFMYLYLSYFKSIFPNPAIFNGKDSNSWNHFWECRHLLFFKEDMFGVVWALGGSNSN